MSFSNIELTKENASLVGLSDEEVNILKLDKEGADVNKGDALYKSANDKYKELITLVNRKRLNDLYLKTIHPSVVDKTSTVVLEDGSGFVFRHPKREVLVRILSRLTMSNGDPVSAGQIILDDCMIGFDPIVMEDDTHYASACLMAAGSINILSGDLKKN